MKPRTTHILSSFNILHRLKYLPKFPYFLEEDKINNENRNMSTANSRISNDQMAQHQQQKQWMRRQKRNIEEILIKGWRGMLKQRQQSDASVQKETSLSANQLKRLSKTSQQSPHHWSGRRGWWKKEMVFASSHSPNVYLNKTELTEKILWI